LQTAAAVHYVDDREEAVLVALAQLEVGDGRLVQGRRRRRVQGLSGRHNDGQDPWEQ